MNKKRLIGYLFVMVSAGCIHAQEKKVSAQEYKLWYDRPAQVWTEALPLGNGRLGAMVYGTPGIEQIQLNEETIWAGRPNNNANPNALEYIPKVRELVFCRKISGSTNARYGESDGKNKFGNALSEFRRPENCLPRTYPLFRLLSGTESGLGTCHRPL